MNKASQKPPTLPGNSDAPRGLTSLGEVPSDTLKVITSLRSQSAMILQEIGRLEIRKQSLIAQANLIESQTQGLLKGEAERLGIPEGAPWQLTPDGTVLVERGG